MNSLVDVDSVFTSDDFVDGRTPFLFVCLFHHLHRQKKECLDFYQNIKLSIKHHQIALDDMDCKHNFQNLTNLEREVEEENDIAHARELVVISAQPIVRECDDEKEKGSKRNE